MLLFDQKSLYACKGISDQFFGVVLSRNEGPCTYIYRYLGCKVGLQMTDSLQLNATWVKVI